MKRIKLGIFINGDTPPDLGLPITWYDSYTSAIDSTDEISGYFKPNSDGGRSNIMVIADENYTLPITELDISNTDSFSMVVIDKALINQDGMFITIDDCEFLNTDATVDFIIENDEGYVDDEGIYYGPINREVSTKGKTKKIKDEKKDKLKEKKWKIKE